MPEPIDLEALEAVARAATPGLWLQDEHEDGDEGFGPTGMSLGWGVHTGTDGCDPDLDVRHYDPEIRTGSVEDATYIATFDPPTVLALIERLRAAEKRADDCARDAYNAEGERDATRLGLDDFA